MFDLLTFDSSLGYLAARGVKAWSPSLQRRFAGSESALAGVQIYGFRLVLINV